jgi:hypothetical protein
VFELLVIGLLGVVVLAVFGVFWAVGSLICWILFLPFKLLGLIFRGFAFLLALPFLLLAGFFGVMLFGAGMLLFLVPALPLVLIALGVWWLMRRRSHPAAQVSV